MLQLYRQRIRDIVVFAGFPTLRHNLRRARNEGLETLLDYQRLAMLTAALSYTSHIEGDLIEFGTFRGGSAGVILQEISLEKTLHICDSFEGMPDASAEDNYHKKGDFSDTAAEKVRAGLAKLGGNFEMHVGYFSDTLREMKNRENLTFSFAHIDADLYQSILECLGFCYPLMAKGSVIIFDDYGSPTCLGAKQAVDEFFEDKPETVVPLSQPSYACIIGGGDAFDEIAGHCGFPANLSYVRSMVFEQKAAG